MNEYGMKTSRSISNLYIFKYINSGVSVCVQVEMHQEQWTRCAAVDWAQVSRNERLCKTKWSLILNENLPPEQHCCVCVWCCVCGVCVTVELQSSLFRWIVNMDPSASNIHNIVLYLEPTLIYLSHTLFSRVFFSTALNTPPPSLSFPPFL